MSEPVAAGLSAAKWFTGFRPGYWTKRHNRFVAREYEDRVRWVRDQIQAEATALQEVEVEMAERNLTFSGERGKRGNDVRRRFAQRWRDRRSEGDRKIEDAHDEKNAVHWLRRRPIARRPWPENPHSEEVARLTRGWDERAS